MPKIAFVDAARLMGPFECDELLALALLQHPADDPVELATGLVDALERRVLAVPVPEWAPVPKSRRSSGWEDPPWANCLEIARVTLDLARRDEPDGRFPGLSGRTLACCLAALAISDAVNGLASITAELVIPGWADGRFSDKEREIHKDAWEEAAISAWSEMDALIPGGAPHAALDHTGVAQAFRSLRASFW